MHRQYHKWFSHRVNRDMELLVFGHGGDRVLVFPTRQGRFFDYENWGILDAIRDRVENGVLQLYCVDSYDSESVYAWGIAPWERIARHRCFEEYILREVLPFSRSLNANSRLVAHGCSIGAYHAVNIAFRHPSLFCKVVGLSGRYDLTRPFASFPDLFSGHYDTEIYFHMPSHYIPNVSDPALLHDLRSLDIRLAVGGSDDFFDSNHHLSNVLWDKGVWHAFDVWPGKAHQPQYWREMVTRYL
jgi:esterase/lipase superfamily enzyme